MRSLYKNGCAVKSVLFIVCLERWGGGGEGDSNIP